MYCKRNKCVCQSWRELIFAGALLRCFALQGSFLQFRQSACSQTSGCVCVMWTPAVLMLLLGYESFGWAFILEHQTSSHSVQNFVLSLSLIFVTRISQQLTCVCVCVSTGQYSHTMDSPTSSNWLTQEVRWTVMCLLCLENILTILRFPVERKCCIFVVKLSIIQSFFLCSLNLLPVSVSCLIAGGVAELAGKFHISKPQYGLCRVGSVETGGPRIAMISWVSGRHVRGA